MCLDRAQGLPRLMDIQSIAGPSEIAGSTASAACLWFQPAAWASCGWWWSWASRSRWARRESHWQISTCCRWFCRVEVASSFWLWSLLGRLRMSRRKRERRMLIWLFTMRLISLTNLWPCWRCPMSSRVAAMRWSRYHKKVSRPAQSRNCRSRCWVDGAMDSGCRAGTMPPATAPTRRRNEAAKTWLQTRENKRKFSVKVENPKKVSFRLA